MRKERAELNQNVVKVDNSMSQIEQKLETLERSASVLEVKDTKKEQGGRIKDCLI